MPIDIVNPTPNFVEGGHADFLTKKDYLRSAPEAHAKYVKNWGSDFTFIDLLASVNLASMQDSVPHQSPYKESYYREKDQRRFAIKSVVTPQDSAGGEIVVELLDNEVRNIEGMITSRVRKDETVQDTNGVNWKVMRVDKSENPFHVTLKPIVSTATGTFKANDVFFIIAPSYAEATNQPTGLISDLGRYVNMFAIVKETDLTSGTNMTTKNPFKRAVGLKNYGYLNGQEEAELRHELNLSMMLVHGQLGDGNITQYAKDFDAEVENRDTEGLIQAFLSSGRVQTWDKSQGYGLEQMYRVSAYYRQKKLPKSDILVAQGGEVASAFQKDLLDFMGTNNRAELFSRKYFSKMRYSNAERYKPEDYFLDIGFKGVGIDGYNFLERELTELNSLYGDTYQSNVDYENMRFFMPISVMKDAKSGATIPMMQVVHRGQDLGGYQRRIEVWKTGSAGANRVTRTDEWDVQRCFFRSEAMLEIVGHYWMLTQIGGDQDG